MVRPSDMFKKLRGATKRCSTAYVGSRMCKELILGAPARGSSLRTPELGAKISKVLKDSQRLQLFVRL